MDAMEIMEYHHSFVIRQEETVRFQQFQAAQRTRRFNLFCMLGLTVLARWILVKIVGGTPTQMQVIIACTIGMVVGLALPYFLIQLMVAFNISQKYLNGQAHEYTVDMDINPGGIYLTDGKTEVKVYFDKMFRIRETAADFFIYPDKETAFLLPKHQLDDVKKDSKYLRELFRTYAPANKLQLMKG